ncbi:DNA/RNA non-specific endonuclease [uncultured Rummeliibacillus sp.]|uniref:DNA/RNA non-specific endonuclease n=1 Tax=uncultured Rummeliibacillus sp. TaxID=762292 RepID=UPI00260322C7|nr:DNA/RNA non-specific endonuclease [uncultured Rummeliibacillus sp.]
MAIVCPPAGLAAGVIYTTIDAVGAVKGEDLISGRKLSDEERLTRGAFAIVPGAGGLATKSLLKHRPALGTVMKTASKTVDDAIKPIKNTVDHIALSGKQSVKTAITKTQQKVSTIAVNSVKSVQKSVEPIINEAKQRAAIKAASSKSAFSTKVENAIKLGKTHVDQLKFAVAHPILSTVTSKAGQKSIRGTASIIDNVKRPVYIKSMEVIGGPKIPVGIERPSNDVYKNKGEDLISKIQVKKDAIKGSKGTGNRLAGESEVKPLVGKGEQFTNGRKNRLKPNIRYQTGEYDYFYETDGVGRISKFETDNLQLTTRENRLSHSRNTLGKVKGKDHAGHLAGDRFGGSPKLDNLVSQLSDVNLKQYKKIEDEWAAALNNIPPKKVTVDVEILYEDIDVRPKTFIVNYTIDGKSGFKIIEN